MKRKLSEVEIYQLDTISTPHYVDYGGNMNHLDTRFFLNFKLLEFSKMAKEVKFQGKCMKLSTDSTIILMNLTMSSSKVTTLK
jgi:hypothetical protein